MSEQKKGRGRPKADDAAILAGIKNNPTAIAALQAFEADIAGCMNKLEIAQDNLKDAIEAAADGTGLSKGHLKKSVAAKREGTKNKIVSETETLVETVELMEKRVSESEPDSF